jgi:hypothetical protein
MASSGNRDLNVVSGSRDGKYLSQGLTRYYQEIYMPAIKEAGFEPVRADELFTTGSVVEQIWEQIEKAKLLLADLSGKNPNVFYELAARGTSPFFT